MKAVLIVREPTTDQGTFGRMTTGDGKLVLPSLELPWRDLNGDGLGDPQFSCITPGKYRATWHKSPSKGMCYLLHGVQGRSHILIHSANFAGDSKKGWVAQLLGCIALGKGRAVMLPDQKKYPGTKPQQAVTSSVIACNEFFAWAAKQDIEITIR